MKRHLVFIYWLLLLVSTLAIGGMAFYLLQRESGRLRGIASNLAEQTGKGIVAGLSANVSRSMTDTLDQLAALPEDENLEMRLRLWRDNNPLARNVVMFKPDTGLILPLPYTPERAELEPLLHGDTAAWPWGDADLRQPSQRLFLTLQKIALPPGGSANQPPSMPLTQITGLPSDLVITPTESSVDLNNGMPSSQTQFIIKQPTYEIVASITNAVSKPDGWKSIGRGPNQRWLGWVRAASSGTIRGVVLSWDELEKTMARSFPPQIDNAVGFVLVNPAGRTVVSRFAKSAPAGDDQAIPLSFHVIRTLSFGDNIMPGWQLQVWFNPTANFASGWTAVSTIMVTILVMAVLIGGTLLMREARREASEAARKTSFVSNVSHELKTPLTTIRMYAELLGEGRVRDQLKQNNYLATIIAESQRLTRLVNNVLDFSRLEQGRKQYHPADVALTPIIDSVINSQKPRLDEAGFTLGCSYPGGPPVRVHADRDALEQVLLNLIDNSLKYAASGRWIGIHVSTDAHFAYVAVSDRGPGVPLDHRERIFETFHRVDDSITASQPGAGLGLSIARRLLRDQEGDLTYQSHEPHGASFVAKVPLAAAISAAKIA